jgi:D-cysteine desulfhydrase family pyridoxal phosphate-dependent enzyme
MNLPRVRLATLPTPIESLPRLSTLLGGPQIWIKRDDLTGAGLGGNHLRKLEYILAEVVANGAKTIITSGSTQSDHCRITAAVAAKSGVACILVLEETQPEQPKGNLWLDQLFGAEIVYTTQTDCEKTLREVFDHAWEHGCRPYIIPFSGSSAVGILGYKDAFDEFLSQNIEIDTIIVAASSGGTMAGLQLGAKMTSWPGKILGISINDDNDGLEKSVADLVNSSADLIQVKTSVRPEEIMLQPALKNLEPEIFDERVSETIRLFARNEGILLDSICTGKAASTMIDLIRSKYFRSDEKIQFWHTGGLPGLY